MTATTYTRFPGTNRGVSAGNWFGRMFDWINEAQELAARKRVSAVFRNFDEETLKYLGFNADEIGRIGRGEQVTIPSA